VTLHEAPRTHQMIADGQLAGMKKGAHLINASRGTIVDIDALVEALKSGHLAGAGMDVFLVELKHKLEEVPGTIRTRILY